MADKKQTGAKQGIAGGCACGSVRYTLAQMPERVGACHCGMCRRWMGGGPFMSFQADTVELAKSDDLAWWRSSGWGERGFCSKCGTSLFWRLQRGTGNWVVTASTLDKPGDLKMEMHIYIDDKPAYYDFDDSARRMTGAEFTAMVFSEMKLPMRWIAKSFYALSQLKPSPKPAADTATAAKRGSCNCGATKFSLSDIASEITFCQCPHCLKAHGGAAGLWAKADGLKFENEEALAWWTDPEGCERGFCRKCGSSLARRQKGDAGTDIAVGALENSDHLSASTKVAHSDNAPPHVNLTLGTSS